jgi:peptidoglycan hydrolase-like protein with peptidoglycan-binding domain
MGSRLSWLPGVLRGAGLKVAEQPGWLERGREPGEIKGVICHHTGTPADGIMPTLKMLVDGVIQANGKPLSGPLAQLGLGRDGTFFVVAGGRCNHAGVGAWKGLINGNMNFIGIEAENRGTQADPWPQVQLDAYRRGVAAILRHIGATPDFCCSHREYALPPGRKIDPHGLLMDEFREQVAALMAGTGVITNPVIPAVDPAGRRTLRRGAKGEVVKVVQLAVGVDPDGTFGPATEAAVRAFQRAHQLVPDGIVGPRSWALIPGVSMLPSARQIPAPTGAARSRLAWGKKVTPAFRARVFDICEELAIVPDHLMACMAFESGESFSPSKENAAGSHAIGLIQFMPTTAAALGTTTEKLAAMSAEDQLLFVRKYFLPQKGRLHNLGDVYMAILWPAAVGKPDAHPLFVQGQTPVKRYLQNRGLDINKDGVVTRAEAGAKVAKALDRGLAPENVFESA